MKDLAYSHYIACKSAIFQHTLATDLYINLVRNSQKKLGSIRIFKQLASYAVATNIHTPSALIV